MQGAKDAQGVTEGGSARGAEQHGDPAAVAGVDDLPGGAGGPQPRVVGGDDPLRQVQLLQGRGERPAAVVAVGQVQRPEHGADLPLAQPRQVRVDGALPEVEVVPGQSAQRPRQAAVAVADGVGGEDGLRAVEGASSGSETGRYSSGPTTTASCGYGSSARPTSAAVCRSSWRSAITGLRTS